VNIVSYILFIGGIAFGALLAAQPEHNWLLLSLATAVALIGVITIRIKTQSKAVKGKVADDITRISEELTQIYQMAKKLESEWVKLDTEQKKERIEDITALLASLVEKRGNISASMGFKRFSELFVPLAQGERNLYRAWSALVDGHDDEAKQSFTKTIQSWDIILKHFDSINLTH